MLRKLYYDTQHKKRRARLKELKINGCAICGYNKCIDVLHFHHVNSKDKKFRLTNDNMDYRADKILDEVQKCILICANCHGEIHYKDRKISAQKVKKCLKN